MDNLNQILRESLTMDRVNAEKLRIALLNAGYVHESKWSDAIQQARWNCAKDLFKLVGYDAKPQWRYRAKIRKYIIRLVDKWEERE